MYSRWTAVVRGAVIFGIEKADHNNITIAKTCPRSYGIVLNHAFSKSKHDRRDQFTDALTKTPMAKGQFTWFVRKGDLVLSNAPKEVEEEADFNFRETDTRVLHLPIYEYTDDDLPDRFENAEEGIAVILSEPNELTNALPRIETGYFTPLRLFQNSHS